MGETDVVAAPVASGSHSPAAHKKKVASKGGPKIKPTHPVTGVMVAAAIKNLKERGGSSLQAIKKYISANYKADAEKLAPFIKKYIRGAVASGKLVQTKGKGASGSFKIASGEKKVNKAIVKKPKSPKKKAATPKKSGAAKKKTAATKKKKSVSAAPISTGAIAAPISEAASSTIPATVKAITKKASAAKKAASSKSPKKPKSPKKKTAGSPKVKKTTKAKKSKTGPTQKPKAPKPKSAKSPKTKKTAAKKK